MNKIRHSNDVNLSTATVERSHPTSSSARQRNMRLSWTLTLLKVSVLGFSFTLGEPAAGEVNIHIHLQEAREEEEQAKVEHGTDYSADYEGANF